MLAELETLFLQTMGSTDLLLAFVLLELSVLGVVAVGGLLFSFIWKTAAAMSTRQRPGGGLPDGTWPVGC